MNHWTTPVCRDGYLYGIYGFKEFGRAAQVRRDCHRQRGLVQARVRSGAGTILVGDQILVQGDRGPLVLVDAKPDAYHEVARAETYGAANAGRCRW